MRKHTDTSVRTDTRARVQFPDIVMGFATLVSFIAIAPWVYSGIGMASSAVDPLSATLLELTLSIFVIAMLVSLGISAKRR